MGNLIKTRHPIQLFFIAAGILLFQSCVVYKPNNVPAVTVADIVQMSKDGVSSKDIIRDMRQSHTVYWLKADQLAKLRNDGVQDSVINYMEETHIKAVQRNQQMEDSYYWWQGPDGYLYGGLGFGWPYYGYWGWGWGPAIIFSGHGYYGGGGFRGGNFRGGGSFHGGGGFHGGGRR